MYCRNCGKQIEDDVRFCPDCGQSTQSQGAQWNTARPAQSDEDANKAMAVLAYLNILVLIPLFAAKESPFARYHCNQGLVLLLFWICYGVVVKILSAVFFVISFVLGSMMSVILGLMWLVPVALMIIGIINAAKGEWKPLPVIGGIKLF